MAKNWKIPHFLYYFYSYINVFGPIPLPNNLRIAPEKAVCIFLDENFYWTNRIILKCISWNFVSWSKLCKPISSGTVQTWLKLSTMLLWDWIQRTSGVTGGGGGEAGGQSAPRNFWLGNFFWPTGKREAKKKGKMEQKRRKIEKGKVENWKWKEEKLH